MIWDNPSMNVISYFWKQSHFHADQSHTLHFFDGFPVAQLVEQLPSKWVVRDQIEVIHLSMPLQYPQAIDVRC